MDNALAQTGTFHFQSHQISKSHGSFLKKRSTTAPHLCQTHGTQITSVAPAINGLSATEGTIARFTQKWPKLAFWKYPPLGDIPFLTEGRLVEEEDFQICTCFFVLQSRLLENDIVRKVDAHQKPPNMELLHFGVDRRSTDETATSYSHLAETDCPTWKPCVKPLSDFPTCSRNKPNHFSGRNLAAIPS